MDSKLRSLVKSISWRLLGILVLGLIAWIYTGNVEQTSFITITFSGIQLLFYYFHERLWGKRWVGSRKKLKDQGRA